MKRNTLISFEIKQENLEKIRLHMARTTKEQIAFDILTSNDRKCFCEAQSKYVYIEAICSVDCLRPYHVEYTPSRPIWEVKQRRARLVLGWVTAWEYRVL